MSAKRTRTKTERGQSMVEFALALPVVLLLIFGLLEFGRVINAEITAGHCANELARYGVIRGRTEADIRAYAYSDTNPVCPTMDLDEDTLYVNVNVSFPTGESSKAVTVTITYPIEIVTPVIRSFFPDGIYTAHGTATLQLE